MLAEACSSDSAALARRLKTQLRWLETTARAERSAVYARRTLTVAKLDLPKALRGFLIISNAPGVTYSQGPSCSSLDVNAFLNYARINDTIPLSFPPIS